MRRLLITDNGDCFSRFNDGSTIFLSSSCQIVVETDKNNKQVTHIINFINDTLKEKIKQIVNIRNKYFSSISLPPFMQQNCNATKKSLSPLTESIWTQQCQNNVENKQTIQSFDGHTKLQLCSNQHELHISFPIYIKKDVQVTANGSHITYYHHIDQQQIQSIYNHELCWDFPLKLIENKIQNKEINPNNPYLNIVNKYPLPQLKQNKNNNNNSLQNTISKLSQDTMKAIEYFHCMENGIPPKQTIMIEWTLNVIYRIFNGPNYLIETFISFDDSYLVSHLKHEPFIYHYIPTKNKQNEGTQALEYVYSINAIPPIPPDTKQEDAKYNLLDITQNALLLLENAKTQHKFKQTATAKNLSMDMYSIKKRDKESMEIPSMSNEVKDYYYNTKFGEFTYYKDKRVKIHFSDRTMLELNGDWTKCTIITKYAEEIKDIDVNNPIKQFTRYITHAINYAKWCSLSKAEQIHHEQTQIKIQNDIQYQINFTQRLLDTQQMTDVQDYSVLDGYDLDLQSDELKENKVDNAKLIDDIQSHINDIDRLLQ